MNVGREGGREEELSIGAKGQRGRKEERTRGSE